MARSIRKSTNQAGVAGHTSSRDAEDGSRARARSATSAFVWSLAIAVAHANSVTAKRWIITPIYQNARKSMPDRVFAVARSLGTTSQWRMAQCWRDRKSTIVSPVSRAPVHRCVACEIRTGTGRRTPRNFWPPCTRGASPATSFTPRRAGEPGRPDFVKIAGPFSQLRVHTRELDQR